VIESLLPWLPDAEGITISGGEPFDQPEALTILLRELRLLSQLDILVYSGYPFSALAGWLQENPSLIDVVISGPYDERASQTLALRGSDNQQFHFLTELGRQRFSTFDRPVHPEDRRFDVMFDADGSVWLAGIPAKDDIRRLQQALRESGHSVTFSQSNSGEELS
jgi:anaerobic ribonucleoside-triphosphate reductase activating protein